MLQMSPRKDISMAYVFDPYDQLYHRLVTGGSGNDSLTGFVDPLHPRVSGFTPEGVRYAQDELFKGFDGNDRIFGRDGEDVIHGGNGKDILNGGVGNDQLFGEGGNDFLTDPDAAIMAGHGGNDIMRLSGWGTEAEHIDIRHYTRGGSMSGGAGADQFRANLFGVGAIDDEHFGASESVTIRDFHAGQGDKIALHVTLSNGQALTPQAAFDLLDANHDQKLDEADGSTSLGRVTFDGFGEGSENSFLNIGSLHLRLGQTGLEVEHTAVLHQSDFLL
jgi:RTX calcium-binding nonapeptide repeat (4 copies)